jgi:hypothetical protein
MSGNADTITDSYLMRGVSVIAGSGNYQKMVFNATEFLIDVIENQST